jgi:hypothetical protein
MKHQNTIVKLKVKSTIETTRAFVLLGPIFKLKTLYRVTFRHGFV